MDELDISRSVMGVECLGVSFFVKSVDLRKGFDTVCILRLT